MSLPRRGDLLALHAARNQPVVSIYLPVEVTGREVRQNQIRLKNALSDAAHQLWYLGVSDAVVTQLCEPGLRRLEDEQFWRTRTPGLSLLLGLDESRSFWLPYKVPNSVTVGAYYRLRPLLPATVNVSFGYVLAISHDQSRLMVVSEDSSQDVTPANFPRSKSDTLNYTGADRGAQVHGGAIGRKRQAGSRVSRTGRQARFQQGRIARLLSATGRCGAPVRQARAGARAAGLCRLPGLDLSRRFTPSRPVAAQH